MVEKLEIENSEPNSRVTQLFFELEPLRFLKTLQITALSCVATKKSSVSLRLLRQNRKVIFSAQTFAHRRYLGQESTLF